MKNWGYDGIDYSPYFDFDASVPIKRALEGLHLDTKKKTEGGHNEAFYWVHEHDKTIDGTTYKVS